jgi:hypothetical protein
MTRFTVQVRGWGWFPVEAETLADAERAADEAVQHGGVPFDVEWDDCEWDTVEPDE